MGCQQAAPLCLIEQAALRSRITSCSGVRDAHGLEEMRVLVQLLG